MSRLNSPDRRGGGGSGGCVTATEGDFRISIIGVCGLLGIRKCRGDDGAVAEGEDEGECSAASRLIVLDMAWFGVSPFGGELGGSIVTAGNEAGDAAERGF